MTHDEQHAFASADEADLAYRSLSTPAVVGAVLAALSGLVFVSPYLWPLPIAAAAVSLAAVRSIRAGGDAKSGLSLAVAALCLAVAVGSGAYARRVALTSGHHKAAGIVAEEFLRRLRAGDTAGALELTVAYGERLPSAEAAELYYESDEEAAARMKSFLEKPAVAALAKGDPPRLKRKLGVSGGRFGKISLVREYAVSAESEVLLTLERSAPRGELAVAWRVAQFEFAD